MPRSLVSSRSGGQKRSLRYMKHRNRLHGHRVVPSLQKAGSLRTYSATSHMSASQADSFAYLLSEPYQTVYDIFSEVCTSLSAVLVGLKRAYLKQGKRQLAADCERERNALYDEKDSISETDVSAQVELIEKWSLRRRELSETLHVEAQ